MPTPLAALAGFGIAKMLDYVATEKQQANFEYNQQKQQDFTRQMASDATPLAVMGMKKAGLNPAVMSAPLQAVSAPSVSHGAAIPTDISSLAGLASLEIQKQVADAETDKLNAETQHQRIVNQREITADDDYSQAIIERLRDNKQLMQDVGMDTSRIDEDIKRLEENPANLGTFTANMAAIESSTNSLSTFVDKLTHLVNYAVERHIIKNPELIKEMSKRDARESHLLARKIGTEIAQKYYLTQETEKAKEQINNLKKEQTKIDAEIENLGSSSQHLKALANKVSNEDVNTLIANGEIAKAVTAEMTFATNAFSKGFGQGSGAMLAARLGGFSPSSITDLGKMALPQSVGKTTLAKTGGKVAGKLSSIDKRVYGDLMRYYGERNARKYLNGYLNSNYKSFNSYLDAMQKMAKKKK